MCGGRFTVGLRHVAHHWVVDGMLGVPYRHPAALMRSLEVLNAALRGPGKADVENEHFRAQSPIDVTDFARTGARSSVRDAAARGRARVGERSCASPTSA